MEIDTNMVIGAGALVVLVVLLSALQAMGQRFPFKPQPCPKCDSTRKVVPILYGEPDRRMLREARHKRITLGGYKVRDDQEDMHCLACDYKWLSTAR